jgi:hypothetical protein
MNKESEKTNVVIGPMVIVEHIESEEPRYHVVSPFDKDTFDYERVVKSIQDPKYGYDGGFDF